MAKKNSVWLYALHPQTNLCLMSYHSNTYRENEEGERNSFSRGSHDDESVQVMG